MQGSITHTHRAKKKSNDINYKNKILQLSEPERSIHM